MGDLSSLGSFLLALAEHWVALMTGSIIIALLALWEHRRSNAVSWRWYFRLAVLLLFIAFFLMWQQQSAEIVKLRTELTRSITVSLEPSSVIHGIDNQLWILAKANNISEKDVFCRVFLNDLRKKGAAKSLLAISPLQLIWAGGEYESTDNKERTIPVGQSRPFNLALVPKGAHELSLQNKQFGITLPTGVYEFTVQAGHSSCKSAPTKIAVDYKGGNDVHFVK